MQTISKFFGKLTTGLLFALAAAGFVGAARAQGAPPSRGAAPPDASIIGVLRGVRYNCGIIGVLRGETVRLNVALLNADAGAYPPGPARVTLTFVDDQGRAVAQATKSIDPEHARSLNFTPADYPPGPSRQEVRAIIAVDASPDGRVPDLLPTLEVFDAETGRTRAIIAVFTRTLLTAPQ
jgi:hypothetical protein